MTQTFTVESGHKYTCKEVAEALAAHLRDISVTVKSGEDVANAIRTYHEENEE